MATAKVKIGGKRPSARARLLQAADNLFYRRGIRAVGVDEVVREAGVAKVSLYRAFPSKDDLIVAYLEARDQMFWQRWDAALAGISDPAKALRAAIASLCRAIEDPSYRGCPFANFSIEFPDRSHQARVLVGRSKRELRTRLEKLVKDARVPEAAQVAETIFLLAEGAFSASQTVEDGAGQVSRAFARSTELLLKPRR